MKLIVKLWGGLGNQLFQYATAFSLSKKINKPLFCDLTHPSLSIHPFMLDKFKISSKFLYKDDILNENIKNYNSISLILYKKFGLNFIDKSFYIERNFKYQKNFEKINEEKILIGHFLSEKYFINNRNEILNEFLIKNELNIENKKSLNLIKNYNSISIHIRRGDFLSKNNVNDYYICPLDYYKSALKLLVDKNDKNKEIGLFIFSDDLNWAEENLKFNYPTYFISHNRNDSSYEDLRLMSHCNHNIIANSSFSWWAAWLNSNENKIVISPKHWHKKYEFTDIIPNSWITLS